MVQLHEGNGKPVKLRDVKPVTLKVLVKRKWAVPCKDGRVKLAPAHVIKPTWTVEASFSGLHWPLRTLLARAVRGSTGSGFWFHTRRYDVTWEAYSAERAATIAVQLREKIPSVRAKCEKAPRVRVKIYPPQKRTRKLAR
jgi:hypothetical protein